MNKEERKSILLLFFCIFTFYGILFLLGITCPIKFLTGISCPGCGMTRAWLAALSLDFQEAFSFHPLFWLIPVVGLVYWFKRGSNVFRYILAGCIFIFFVVYFYRQFFVNNTIVTYCPTEGAIYKIIDEVIRRFNYVL